MAITGNTLSSRLAELGEFRNGVNFGKGKKGTGLGLINVKDIFRDSPRVDFESLDLVDLAESPAVERYFVEEGDLFFVRSSVKREGIGYVAYSDRKNHRAVHCGFVIRFRPNKSVVDSRFLTYALRSHDTRERIRNLAGGAAITNISQEALRTLELNIPPLAVQRRIAGILSAYDNLIENSQRRIKILEEMARSLYREWFVRFRFPGHDKVKMVPSALGRIPQGWEVKRLDEIAKNFDRLRKPLSKMQRADMHGEYPYYGAAKVFDYVNNFIFNGEYLLMAEDGSVITPERAPVLQLVNEKFWPNNHTHILRGRGPVSTHFLYLALSRVDISPYITGAAQPKITQENMNRIPFFCGSADLHKQFDSLVAPMIYGCQVLQRETANLRRTRDLLLPRLLSGQIHLKTN